MNSKFRLSATIILCLFFHINLFARISINEKSIQINTPQALLSLDKQNWSIKISSLEGEILFLDAIPPAFKIQGEWRHLQKIIDVTQSNNESVLLNAALGDDTPVNVCIEFKEGSAFHFVVKPVGVTVDSVRGAAVLYPQEEIYGFGETWNGGIAQRGKSLDIWDKPGTPDECAYMPYYVSTRHYGFLLNYGGAVHFDVGQTEKSKLSYCAQISELDFTLFAGTSIASVVKSYINYTGKLVKPPRWAYQPWFWLMGDPDIPGADINTLKGEQFPAAVKRLHSLNIPVGVVWFEPPWQTARTTFVPNDTFSTDLKGVISELNSLGVKTLAWTVPYTNPGASNWQYANDHDYFVHNPDAETNSNETTITSSGELDDESYDYIDFFNPKACKWWQQEIKKAIDLGIRGFKLDAGQDLPKDALLYNGLQGKDVHNSYSRQYNKVFYEILEKNCPNDFITIPRAAWVGSGHYTNFKWPGDLNGDFSDTGLAGSVKSSLSLAFCGLPFLSTDIGGFEGRPPSETVWIRWAQFGAMLPGMQTLNMPWWYSEKAVEHYRYLCWLHTDLTPYWMSLGNESAETGAPVCRPLVWTFEDDLNCRKISDQYTVGPWILVAPVLNPDNKRDVYLPAGTWYDFWDDSAYSGEQTIHWEKNGKDGLWSFPLYVREGAIVPVEPSNSVSGFGSEQSKGYLTLAIWPKANGTSEFTMNDREGPVNISAEQTKNEIKLRWVGSEMNCILRIHMPSKVSPSQVTAGEKNSVSLQEFKSKKAFLQATADGWYLDTEQNKMYVRKKNDKQSGLIRISKN